MISLKTLLHGVIIMITTWKIWKLSVDLEFDSYEVTAGVGVIFSQEFSSSEIFIRGWIQTGALQNLGNLS